VPFPIETIVDNSSTDFDLFLDLRGHLVLYAGLGYKWAREELTKLVAGGHRHFLMKLSDSGKARTYEELVRLPSVEMTLAPKERITAIEQVGAEFIKCLYNNEITTAVVAKAETLADVLVGCVAEDKTCIKELSGLVDHDSYTYTHSMRMSAYAVAIALEMGATDREHLHFIALGGIFHDVGKRIVPLPVLHKAGPLTNDEWTLMRSHPKAGFENVNESVMSNVSKEIILHHHESLDGQGYPDKLDKHSLLTEVQIAGVADVFDALTSSRPYQQKRTRYEALDFIKHKLLGVKISADAFRALVSSLAG
jgi:putative nucleotidyltransferase with HDIG domain